MTAAGAEDLSAPAAGGGKAGCAEEEGWVAEVARARAAAMGWGREGDAVMVAGVIAADLVRVAVAPWEAGAGEAGSVREVAAATAAAAV